MVLLNDLLGQVSELHLSALHEFYVFAILLDQSLLEFLAVFHEPLQALQLHELLLQLLRFLTQDYQLCVRLQNQLLEL